MTRLIYENMIEDSQDKPLCIRKPTSLPSHEELKLRRAMYSSRTVGFGFSNVGTQLLYRVYLYVRLRSLGKFGNIESEKSNLALDR